MSEHYEPHLYERDRLFKEYFAEVQEQRQVEQAPIESIELMQRSNLRGQDCPRYLAERERVGLPERNHET